MIDGRTSFILMPSLPSSPNTAKSADMIAAAFLHDTIEKSDTSIEELTENLASPSPSLFIG